MNESVHNGQLLESLITKAGYSINEVVDRTGKGRSTIWRWLNNPELDYRKILLVAEAINIDVSNAFPEIEHLKHNETRSESERKLDDNHFRGKYYALLEKHQTLMEEFKVLLEERAEYGKDKGEKE